MSTTQVESPNLLKKHLFLKAHLLGWEDSLLKAVHLGIKALPLLRSLLINDFYLVA